MVRFTSDLTWRHQFQLVNIDLVTTACQDCQQLLFYKFHKELELLSKPMYRVLRFPLFPWKWWQQTKQVSANIQIGFNPTKNHLRSSFLWLDWDYKSWLEFPNCVNLWNRFNAKSWVVCNGARLKKRAWTLWTWFLNLQKCEGNQNFSEPNN